MGTISTSKTGRLIRALDDLSGATRQELTLSQALLFFHVARAGSAGTDQGALADATGLSPAAVSRTVRILGGIHYSKRHAGYGLMETQLDPADNRRRIVRLTSAGTALAEDVLNQL